MHSLTNNYLKKLTFSSSELAALRSLGEYRGKQTLFYQQSLEMLESLKKVAVVESSESSNRLEGITAPKERIEALVFKNSIPKDRSEQEIAGYCDALSLMHESGPHMGFTVNVILQPAAIRSHSQNIFEFLNIQDNAGTVYFPRL